MAYLVINDEHLTAIAEAIRAKLETTDTYKPAEMADAILSIDGLGAFTEQLYFTGDCRYFFYGDTWKFILDNYGDKIRTEDVTNLYSAFAWSSITEVPFILNVTSGSSYQSPFSEVFNGCKYLEKAPVIIANIPIQGALSSFYCHCYRLNDDINFDWVDWDYIHESTKSIDGIFDCCHSLRRVSEDVVKKIYNNSSSTHLSRMFANCYTLDYIRGIYPPPYKLTSNKFYMTVFGCSRINAFVFETDNGTPLVRQWSNQTLDLSNGVGYCRYEYYVQDNILAYNSGITEDKEVSDTTSYEALKNDADWFTADINYSRYNHDSAVETINSLPDTSEYLAEDGTRVVNTIIFSGNAGTLTDGGAINTLTEEQIAVATAKGWTVSYV